MSRFAWAAAFILGIATPALAGPMPKLPDLPPLPTNYVAAGGHEGNYAGILAGAAISGDADPALGVVLGTTTSLGELLVGIEAAGVVDSNGATSVSLDLRGGFSLDDSVAVFAHGGLGYALEAGTYLSVGSSIDFALYDTMTLRAQYRYAHDLSGDAGRHAILAGAIFRF